MAIINTKFTLKQIDSNTKRAVLNYSENIMSVLIRFDHSTKSVDLHHHPHEQITYVLSGRYKFFAGDKSYIVSKGDSLRFLPDEPHGCIVLEAGELLDTFTPMRTDFLA